MRNKKKRKSSGGIAEAIFVRGGKRFSPYLLFLAFLSGLAVLIMWLMGSESAMASLQNGIAHVANFVLNLLGNRTWVIGHTITSSRFSITVVTACTGLFMTAVFLSAVIAYPARFIAKLIGLALGIVGIFTVNIVRLVSLFYIGVYWPSFLDQAHLLVWPSLLIVFSLFLWLFWAGKVTHAPREA
jgi:exosortase/archaeosortase family protein